MKIGVMSDTHRYEWSIEKAFMKLKSCDIIIHLGDNVEDVCKIQKLYKSTIVQVKGNCDYVNNIPCDIIKMIAGKKFFITHGHNYDIKYGIENLKEKAAEVDADIVLYGHTHVSKIDFEDGVYFLNPGSPALPRDGFRSVAVVEINDLNINPAIVKL